ncbi:hypothetical protein [Desulfonatronovibrio magnus]|uniref:hypothetical protein n=1 Tax=Desulfonatronovibrio magnus TaxID=698827 RepID=UPI0012FAADE9|nr:hypothetical protein [Desulfonatronovibrio magnus]
MPVALLFLVRRSAAALLFLVLRSLFLVKIKISSSFLVPRSSFFVNQEPGTTNQERRRSRCEAARLDIASDRATIF